MIYKIKIAFFLPLFFVLSSSDVSAQYNYSCYDSLRQPNPYYICNTEYNPVCGCDGVTYRNSDCARGIGGLNTFVITPEEGPCGEIDVYMVSNYVSEFIEYYVYQKQSGTLLVGVYDIFGTLYYLDSPNFGLKSLVSRQIPIQNLRHGIYFLVIIYNGEPITKKFLKAIRD